jgi:hypothetical protein
MIINQNLYIIKYSILTLNNLNFIHNNRNIKLIQSLITMVIHTN